MSEKKEVNYMITQKVCGACDKAKELLKDKIDAGNIIIAPFETELGKKLADEFKVEATPTIINETNNIKQKCLLSADAKKIICQDGSEKEL